MNYRYTPKVLETLASHLAEEEWLTCSPPGEDPAPASEAASREAFASVIIPLESHEGPSDLDSKQLSVELAALNLQRLLLALGRHDDLQCVVDVGLG